MFLIITEIYLLLFRTHVIYNAEGEVTNKNTYQWDERNSGYILKETEKFTK